MHEVLPNMPIDCMGTSRGRLCPWQLHAALSSNGLMLGSSSWKVLSYLTSWMQNGHVLVIALPELLRSA